MNIKNQTMKCKGTANDQRIKYESSQWTKQCSLTEIPYDPTDEMKINAGTVHKEKIQMNLSITKQCNINKEANVHIILH